MSIREADDVTQEGVMKACPVCGLDLEDTYLFCPEDGSPLDRAETVVIAEELPESRPQSPPVEESNVNNASPVVLYCPACAAEYPLTFSECPVHGVTLTKHKIPTFAASPRKSAKTEAAKTDAAETEKAAKTETARTEIARTDAAIVSQPPPSSYETV